LYRYIEVTMMRGAQSGGVVSYNDGGNANAMSGDAGKGLRSVRVRVVNGKRTVGLYKLSCADPQLDSLDSPQPLSL
jgi:hypothetical protein